MATTNNNKRILHRKEWQFMTPAPVNSSAGSFIIKDPLGIKRTTLYDIAKEDIIDTINEIEIEICSDIIRTKTEIKKDNVSTRQLIRQKAEKIDKNVSKLADRQDLTDKMIEDEANELEDKIEELYEKEADDLEKEIDDQFNEEFDQIESEINQLTNGNN